MSAPRLDDILAMHMDSLPQLLDDDFEHMFGIAFQSSHPCENQYAGITSLAQRANWEDHSEVDGADVSIMEVEHIASELRHMTEVGRVEQPSIDSGVDGESDDATSEHSSESFSSYGSYGASMPSMISTAQLAASSRSSNGPRSAPSVKPRSAEALVASISDWEKDLLVSKFGVTVPDHLPLTKAEDRVIRSALRKIRNKTSAQKSRRNKEGYIVGLESRVESVTRINVELGAQVTSLQAENRSLLEQLNDLRRLVARQAGPMGGSGITLMMAVFCMGMQTGGLQTFDNSSRVGGFQSRTLKSVDDVSIDDMVWATMARTAFFALFFTVVIFFYFAPKRLSVPPPLSWWWSPAESLSRSRFIHTD